MALKWAGILVAVVAVTLTATANALGSGRSHLLGTVNTVAIAAAAAATVIAVVADLYVRIDTRLSRLQEQMASRFDKLEVATGDRNSGFVEGYLLNHAAEGSVVPMTPRARRASTTDD